MSKSQKQMEKEQERNRKIIDTAFQVFVKRKIEGVSMAEIAEAAGVGRATLFRCYPSKMELVIAVCSVKWKEYLDNLDAARPISGLQDIPAINRLTFSLDCYVDMYRNHKELLQYNDNFNYYVTHEEGEGGQDLPDGYSGGGVYACHGAHHDVSMLPFCRRLYLGSGGQ